MEDFDFEFQPSIDRKLVEDLATLRLIDEHRPIIFLGQPGCGKTHLAVALLVRAVEAGYRGYLSTADAMVKTLPRADHDRTDATKTNTHTSPTVPAIDDDGLPPLKTPHTPSWFLEVLDTRQNKGPPTIATTNRGPPECGSAFGDTVEAAAVLDRLMHNAAVFNISGPNWRLKDHNSPQIANHPTRPQQDPPTSPAPTRTHTATRLPVSAKRDSRLAPTDVVTPDDKAAGVQPHGREEQGILPGGKQPSSGQVRQVSQPSKPLP